MLVQIHPRFGCRGIDLRANKFFNSADVRLRLKSKDKPNYIPRNFNQLYICRSRFFSTLSSARNRFPRCSFHRRNTGKDSPTKDRSVRDLRHVSRAPRKRLSFPRIVGARGVHHDKGSIGHWRNRGVEIRRGRGRVLS